MSTKMDIVALAECVPFNQIGTKLPWRRSRPLDNFYNSSLDRTSQTEDPY